jgi:Mg/Co/Ni transporter MgtE
MSRYTDAYRVASATVALGTVIKVVGVLLGLLIGFGMFAVAAAVGGPGPRGGGAGLVLGLFFGGATFAFFFVLGVILSSFGQLKKAALDGAVNSSPFLTNEQRADVMSLR